MNSTQTIIVSSIMLTCIGVAILIFTSYIHTKKFNNAMNKISKKLDMERSTLKEILETKKETSAKLDLLAEQFKLKVDTTHGKKQDNS